MPGMTKIRSLCVYCGASGRVPEAYKQAARDLGTELGRRGIDLVYGGGKVGLMGVIADAAIAAGGKVIGIIPNHLMKLEVGHGGASELIVVDTMHERKQIMFDRADAFAILPGGLGTLDETFEIVTWKQLRLHDKPVIVVDIEGYWQPLQALLEHMITAGFVNPVHRGLMDFVPDLPALFEALERTPAVIPGPEIKWQ